MPLPPAVLAALAALPSAQEAAAAQSLCKPERVVDAYLSGRTLPRNDAQFKRRHKEQMRQQQLAELDAAPQSERYGIRFNSRAGRWLLYIDNHPAATSTDIKALMAVYPDLLHTYLVDALNLSLKKEEPQ